MTSSDLQTDNSPEAQAVRLGHTLRTRRKMLGISVVAAAEAAGISRVTWHRLEKGEMTVAWGSMLGAAAVLGMTLSVEEAKAAGRVGETTPNLEDWLPLRIQLDDYPGLRSLAWQIREGLDSLDPREAWEIYERNWRHLEPSELSKDEQALIQALRRTFDRSFHDV
jgi:transcriptional regulator with XRE-family HTH domain